MKKFKALRGSVVRYDKPFDPVAEGDWEVNEEKGDYMQAQTIKANLYKMIDALPRASLAKVKEFLEGLTKGKGTERDGHTIEDKAWFASSDEDLMNALKTIEKDVTKAEMKEYLDAFEKHSKPVKWDAKRGVFIIKEP